MAISDRIAVLSQGRLMQLGCAEEIYERPTSEFVASFIGRSNLLTGRLQENVSDNCFGLVESSLGMVRCWFRLPAPAGASVKFLIRPENINSSRTLVNGPNVFAGKVASRVYLGEVVEYAFQLGEHSFISRCHPSISLQPGEDVFIQLPPDRTVAICE
jgi:iron(III) transport system ATP-binding protein